MGGLAHYFERAGIATTQVSLIRLHTEKIRPPRALWVPFELGRPFGPAQDAAFQARVVAAALALLEAPSGPVLVDFPDDVPRVAETAEGWVCPVAFAAPPKPSAGPQALAAALAEEAARLRPWYERARREHGRTTLGASGVDIDGILAFVACLVAEPELPEALPGFTLPDAIRLAAEDLKAYYFEAACAQPGAVASDRLLRWFWDETSAGAVLRALKARFETSDDAMLQLLGQLLLVPRAALEPPT